MTFQIQKTYCGTASVRSGLKVWFYEQSNLEIQMLMFRGSALKLYQSRANPTKALTPEMSALKSLCSGQITLSTLSMKPNIHHICGLSLLLVGSCPCPRVFLQVPTLIQPKQTVHEEPLLSLSLFQGNHCKTLYYK